MMEQVRDIYLHGRLGRKYGKHHRIAVTSPKECVRALSILLNAEEDIKRGDYRFVVGDKKQGISIVDETVAGMRFRHDRAFHLVPNPRGAGFNPIWWVVIAVSALTVATVLLRPQIKTPSANDRQDDKTSFVFDGPVNVTEQGQPVPLVYGRVRTGSVVVSAGIETTDLSTDVLQQGGGGSDGIAPGFANGGTLIINNDLVALKGGKGGGSTRSAQEDPNSLQSQATARIVEAIAEGEIVGLVSGLKSIYLDDTPIQNSDDSFNFKGVAIEERVGLPSQTYMPGFAQQEATREIGIEVTNLGGGIIQNIQNPDANRARVTLRLNALSRQDTTNGDLLRTSVTAVIELRPNGGGFTTVVTHEFNGKTTSPYQRSFDIQLPAGGFPWSIRVRRITADNNSAAINDKIIFDLLTEIVDAKLTYPDTAVIGITIDAKQFGSNVPSRGYEVDGKIIEVPSNYNPVTRIYNGVWDGTFKRAFSNNPAWVFRDICINPRYGLGRRITPDKIDKFSLYQIAQYCDQLIPNGKGGTEPRYTINTTISDREEAYNVLQAIASNCRAIVYMSGGQIIMSQEVPQTPVKLVTPSNVEDDGFEYDDESLDNFYSAFVISWSNPEDNFRTNMEVVEDAALVQRLGWKTKEVTAFGVTSQGQARRIGMWMLEDQQYASTRVKYKTGFDHADLFPGKIIQIADPDNTISRRGGRIVSATTTSFVPDKPLTIDAGSSFSVQVMMPDGTIATRSITNTVGTHTTINLASALPATPLPGAVWTFSSNIVSPQQFRVSSIKESGPGVFEIGAIAYDPGRFERVEQNVVIAPIPFTDLPTGPLIAPKEIRIREFLKQVGNAQVPSVAVSWTPAEDPRVIEFQMQVRRPGALDFENIYQGKSVSADVENTFGGIYTFRVRSLDGIGRVSPWRQLEQVIGGLGIDQSQNQNGGNNAAIPDVTNLRSVLSDQVNQPYLEWTPPAGDTRQFVYEVWFTPDLTVAGTFLSAKRIELTTSTRGRIIDIGRYWVRTTFVGRVSPNPPSIDVGSEIIPKFDYSTIINRPRSLADLDPGTKASFDTVQAIANGLLTSTAEQSTRITNLNNEIADARGGGTTLAARLTRIETTQVSGTGATSAQVTALESEIAAARGSSSTLAARLGLLDITVAAGSTVQAQRIAVLEAGLFRGVGGSNLLANALFENGATGLENWRNISTGSGSGLTFTRQGNAGDRTLSVAWTNSTSLDRTIATYGTVLNSSSAAIVIPGRRYGAGIRLRTKTGNGFAVAPTIRWLKSDFSQSTEYFPASFSGIGSTPLEASTAGGIAWFTAIAPPDAVYAIIEVYVNKQNQADTGAGSVTFDNPIICEVDPQSAIPPAFNSNNFARLASVESALFTPGSGLVSRLSTLETTVLNSDVGTLTARIAAEEIARANSDNALASRAGVLEASVKFTDQGLNRNPTFNGQWVSGQFPDNWAEWVGGTSNTRVTGQYSPYAVQFAAPAGANRGISQSPPDLAPYTPGWYVIEADVTLISGTLEGAGVLAQVTNNSGASVENLSVNFFTDVDTSGAVPGAGTVNRTYRFRKLVQFVAASAQGFAVYAMANWDGFSASRPAKTIVFHRVLLRQASDSEIELRAARGAATSVGARIATEEQARATADGALATRAADLEAQMAGTNDSGLRARIAAEETARVNADSALATKTTTLEAQMAGTTASNLQSRIATEEQTRANADNTLSNRTNVVESTITTGNDALNKNPNFAGSWSSGQLPTNWFNWSNGTANTNVTGIYSPNAVRYNTAAGTDVGILQATSNASLPVHAPGYFVIEADVTLVSGTLSGSGVYFQVFNGGSLVADARLDFATDPDANGTVQGAGVGNRAYRYRKLVQVAYNGPFTDTIFYAMASWSGFNASRPTKDIVFHRVAWRPATEAEIELRIARGGASSLTSRITTTENTTANINGRLTAAYGIQVDAGGRIASMKLLSDGTTSGIVFNASAFQVFNGTSNEAPFEVVGGLVKIKNANIGQLTAANITTRSITADRITVGGVTQTELASGAVRNISAGVGGLITAVNNGGGFLYDVLVGALTINTEGNPVLITFSMQHLINDGNGQTTGQAPLGFQVPVIEGNASRTIIITNNGTEIFRMLMDNLIFDGVGVSDNDQNNPTIFYRYRLMNDVSYVTLTHAFTPSAGTNNVAIYMRLKLQNVYGHAFDKRTMYLQEFKR